LKTKVESKQAEQPLGGEAREEPDFKTPKTSTAEGKGKRTNEKPKGAKKAEAREEGLMPDERAFRRPPEGGMPSGGRRQRNKKYKKP